MGRNKKTGLDYFPFDVDTFQDIKIRKLIKYQGGKAITVYALLLCLIYKSGYYMRWDEELPFIISEQTGFEEAYILEVIKSCVALGLFSKEMFDVKHVLTSKGIQERYQDISKQIKRKCDFSEYSMISSEEKPISSEKKGISSEEMPISSEKKAINPEKSTQNKRKGNKNIPPIIPPLGIDPDYGDEILPMEKLKSEIPVSQSIWLEQIAMLRHLTPHALNAKLDEFFDYLTVRGKTELSVKNFKNYFGNWLDKGLKNKKEEDNGTITW